MFNLKNYKYAESEDSRDVANLATKGDLAHFPEQAKSAIDKTEKTLNNTTPDKSKIDQIKNIPQTQADKETLGNYGMVDAYVRLSRDLRDRQPAERMKLFDSIMSNTTVGQKWTPGDIALAKDLIQKVETNNLSPQDRTLINSAAVQTLGQTLYNQFAPQVKALMDKQENFMRRTQLKANTNKKTKIAQMGMPMGEIPQATPQAQAPVAQQPEQTGNPLPILPVEDIGEFISKMLDVIGSGNETLFNQAQSEVVSNISDNLASDATGIFDSLKEQYLGDITNEEEIALTLTKLFSLLPTVQNSGEQIKEPVMAKTFNLSQHVLNNDPKFREILQKEAMQKEAMQKEAYTNLGDAYLIYGPTEKRICPKLSGKGGGKVGASNVVSEEICRFHCLDGIVIDDNKTICGEAIFRGHLMDKFSREYVDKDGNIVGGYLNKRFEINRNVPEENKMRLKPGELRKPRPAEWGNTESRLQAMRQKEGDSRGYEPVTNSGDPFVWSSDVDQNNVEQTQTERDNREEASGHQLVDYTKKDKQENNPKMPKTASVGTAQFHFLLKKLETAASPIEADEIIAQANKVLPPNLLNLFLQESDKKFADNQNKLAQAMDSDGWENEPAQVPSNRETQLKKYPLNSPHDIRFEKVINNVAAILDVDGLSVIKESPMKYRYMINGMNELAKFILVDNKEVFNNKVLMVKIYAVPGVTSKATGNMFKFHELGLAQKINDLFETVMIQESGPSSFASSETPTKKSFNLKEHKTAQLLEEPVAPKHSLLEKDRVAPAGGPVLNNDFDEILYQLSQAETEDDFQRLEEVVMNSNNSPKERESLLNIVNNTKNSKLNTGAREQTPVTTEYSNPYLNTRRNKRIQQDIDVDSEAVTDRENPFSFASNKNPNKKGFNLNKFKTAQMTGPRGPYGIDNPSSDDLGTSPDYEEYNENFVEPEPSPMTDEFISQINNATNIDEIDQLVSEAHNQAAELGLNQRDLDEIMDMAIGKKENMENMESITQEEGLTSYLSNIQKIKTAKAEKKATDVEVYKTYVTAIENTDDLEALKQIEETLKTAKMVEFFHRKIGSIIIDKRTELANPNYKTAKKKKTKGTTYKKDQFKVNPWAVCNKSTGGKKKNPEKFERCVKDVKKKSKVKSDKKSFNLNEYKTAQAEPKTLIQGKPWGSQLSEPTLSVGDPVYVRTKNVVGIVKRIGQSSYWGGHPKKIESLPWIEVGGNAHIDVEIDGHTEGFTGYLLKPVNDQSYGKLSSSTKKKT